MARVVSYLAELRCVLLSILAFHPIQLAHLVFHPVLWSQVFTDMPGGGFQGNEIDVVITGDALIKKCPSVKNRIGEEGGPLASMPQMQVRATLIIWRTLHQLVWRVRRRHICMASTLFCPSRGSRAAENYRP